MYKEIKRIQDLLWKNDDLMEQDDLFELQDYVAKLLLRVAQREHEVDDLLQSYPYMYQNSLK